MDLETRYAAFGTAGEPPDTMGAAGPNDVVAFDNGGFSIFSKTGALISRTSKNSFWTSVLGADPGTLADPRLLYDPTSQRWFAIMHTKGESTNNKILFARSNTSDPTQGFKGVALTTTNNLFADFPTLGLDANGIYVGTNNLMGGSLVSVGMYSLPKADLIADTPTLANLTTFSSEDPNTRGFTLQAAVNYGPKLTTDPTPILAVNNQFFNRYNFTPLSGTIGPGATLGATTVKSVQATSFTTPSPQLGTATTLPNGTYKFSGNAVQIGNFLYATHGITVNGRSAVRWTVANATTFAIVQQGTISDSNLSFFYPSIAVNTSGDVVVGFSGSSGTTYASTYAVAGTSVGGAPGGSLTFGTTVQAKSGTAPYNLTRWGDYSAITVDPADPGIFWSFQEYAAIPGPSFSSNWATQASEVIPTKAGERRWSNPAGGNFDTATNYFINTAPVPTDHVIFSRPDTSYAVTFSGASSSDRASVRQGDVTWNLAGASYTLSNSNAAMPSLAVAEFQGTASLTVSGGSLDTINGVIGGDSGGSGALTLNSGATWTSSGSLFVGGDSLGAGGTGTLNIGGGSTVAVADDLTTWAAGTVNLSGGNLIATTLNVTDGLLNMTGGRLVADSVIGDLSIAGGTLAPGDSPGFTTITGNYTQQASATLEIEIGGPAQGSEFDFVSVSGDADLGGTLTVSLLDDFMPGAGNLFEILTAVGGVTGTFADELWPIINPLLSWSVLYGANSVQLGVVPALEGDYNVDGRVDAADYVVWRKSDGTPDGFNTWRANFGNTLSGSGSGSNTIEALANVPEPASALMGLLAMLIVAPGLARMRPH